MKYLYSALFLIIVCGCSLRTTKPLGESAPAFGSSPEYSTTEGFVVGKWKRVYDLAAMGGKSTDTLSRLMNNGSSREVDIRKDGSFDITIDKDNEGTGTWVAAGDGIDLVIVSVNGVALKTMKEFATQPVVIHLTLHEDGKRLQQTIKTRAGGLASSPIEAWERVLG